jgi:hypothetical protein
VVGDQLAQGAQDRVAAAVIVDSENATTIQRGMGDAFGFTHGQRQRRLAKNMLARGQCGENGLGVVTWMVGDIDTMDGRLGQQIAEVGKEMSDRVMVGKGASAMLAVAEDAQRHTVGC